jgi:transcriptional regulator with XRE-family HTH domain
MQKLGSRIRLRRESLSIQVNDLAGIIGVTPSLISQIERAKAFPSIVTLKKIAEALQTTVGALIGEHETYSDNPLLRYGEKKMVQSDDQGAILYLLSNHDQQKMMEPYLLELPGESDTSSLISTSPGQSFYHVLKGFIRISMESHQYQLHEGDSFYINSGIKLTLTNIGSSAASLLWISATPSASL